MKNRIEKAPDAITNTFVIEIKGLSVYPNTLKFQHINASVRFTSDEHGEMLSIFDPSTKKQVIVPFEQVGKLVEHTRKQRKQ